jgi:hypothetical protein
MQTFIGIPLEERTTSGNGNLNWEGVIGDILITISAKKTRNNKFNYIVYVDLCGFPEKWWIENKLKIAEAKGDNIQMLELDIKRQLMRFKTLAINSPHQMT